MCPRGADAHAGGMAQITAPHDIRHLDDLPARDDDARAHLRTTIPVAVAVALLFGVMIAGSLALRSLLDFGVWFLSS